MTLTCIQDLQQALLSGETNWGQYGSVSTKRLGDLILFNYTAEAMMNNQWTWLETVSRGLILNAKTGEVVARPFDSSSILEKACVCLPPEVPLSV
jgi:RNA ligase